MVRDARWRREGAEQSIHDPRRVRRKRELKCYSEPLVVVIFRAIGLGDWTREACGSSLWRAEYYRNAADASGFPRRYWGLGVAALSAVRWGGVSRRKTLSKVSRSN